MFKGLGRFFSLTYNILLIFRFQRKFKLLLIILLGVSTFFGFYFSLAVYGYISGSAANIFMGLCLQYFFTFATTPLYYEAAVEVTYPVSEGKIAF
jgi:FLVCR family MFS transporter